VREIKFRAWDMEHKVMIENVTPFQHDFVLERDTWKCLQSHDEKGEAMFRLYGHTYSDIMQFTGLEDKNGKEIYEGDIVTYGTEDEVVNAIVEFAEEDSEESMFLTGFQLKVITSVDYPEEEEDNDYALEVIGNIYENGDLLNGK
jgi:uncharacterized phage protein (TIGR01671 family)